MTGGHDELTPTLQLPLGAEGSHKGTPEMAERLLRPIEKALRRSNLSPGSLSYNSVFKLFVNSFDVIPRFFFKTHFASLPPAHLRCRVGVGRQVLNNQVEHLHGVRLYWLYALSKGYVDMGSNI